MGKKLLVVDDEPMIRELIKDFFEIASYEVHEASSGKSAFEMILGQQFDCVISDVSMPDGNGIELARNILLLKGKRPKTIFISGLNEISDSELQALGVEQLVPKPFLPEELVTIVNQYLKVGTKI